ncbi:MAG TPA: hypothetical protein VGK48_06160 [Terriglobia bacterium]|jgi:hypothetical protein
MRKIILLTIFCTLVSTAAFSQDNEIPHNDVNFSVGAGVPTGSDTSYLTNAPMIALMYGYRFNRFIQAESGFQMAFGAANNQNAEESEFGTVQGGDHELMFPFSGRFYVPLPLEKWQLSLGGGGAYLHYAETAVNAQGSPCFTCTTRGGWGTQGFLTIRYLIGDNFYVGTTAQVVSAHINGDAVGNVPAISTTDQWTNVLFNLGFRF